MTNSAADVPGRPILRAEQLTKRFHSGRGRTLVAVDRLDLELHRGRALAVVGESGSGKSTLARLLAGLYPPSSGRILLNDEERPRRLGRRRALHYSRHVQMIFQDPFASLNPVKTVGHHLTRPLQLHHGLNREASMNRALEVMQTVGLEPADEIVQKYPHQLSGGQRQRVALAAALEVEPAVLIADEPTSMLDVSIRVGLLNLIDELKQTSQIALLFITHDLASARYVADQILVLYRGQMVEQGPTEELLANPRHPYTQLLLAAVPSLDGPVRPMSVSRPASATEEPLGCRFAARCPHRLPQCTAADPSAIEVAPMHVARCFAVSSPPGAVSG